MGRDQKGKLYSVENDVGSFTLRKLGVPGWTDGFNPEVNYTASDLVEKGWYPILVAATQLEELTHSLDILTSGGNPLASDEKKPVQFENCVLWSGQKR